MHAASCETLSRRTAFGLGPVAQVCTIEPGGRVSSVSLGLVRSLSAWKWDLVPWAGGPTSRPRSQTDFA